MLPAWLLTVIAWAGAAAGVFLHERRLSGTLAAAGGGVLFGVALFWLVPEMAQHAGKAALLYAAIACALIAVLDRILAHTGHSPGHGVLGPVLAATAAHSLLDGWALRALAAVPLTGIAVPLGLALHKFPEGLALGWITRTASRTASWALALCIVVEGVTLIGAAVEPVANRSATAAFGPAWTIAILAIIAGAFLFFGLHAVLPEWRRAGVLTIFLAAVLAVALMAWKFPAV
jgi:zinc transporter ZupT